MVIPLTRMWFIVDAYSDSRLTKERVFAEYDIIKKQIVWKQWSNDAENQNMSIVAKILGLSPLATPLLIVPIIKLLDGYSKDIAYPIDRLQRYYIIIPIILGVILFFCFDYLMLHIRKKQKMVKVPVISEQKQYFVSIFENTMRHNNTVGVYNTPYIASIVGFSFMFGVDILMFWLYNQRDTTATFTLKLIVLAILISVSLMIIWSIFRAILMKKIIKKLTIEMEKEHE